MKSAEGSALTRQVERCAAALLLALAAMGWGLANVSQAADETALPVLGAAPAFTLTSQDAAPVSLRDLKGKVAVVTFIFTRCPDTCPLLTAKLVAIQRKLDAKDAPAVRFAAITVDPEHDTPEVLKGYAQSYGADPKAWIFLTGAPSKIQEVVRQYGVYSKAAPTGGMDHTFLTSLVDRSGMLRVQYMGVQFSPDEFLADVRSLLRENPSR